MPSFALEHSVGCRVWMIGETKKRQEHHPLQGAPVTPASAPHREDTGGGQSLVSAGTGRSPSACHHPGCGPVAHPHTIARSQRKLPSYFFFIISSL